MFSLYLRWGFKSLPQEHMQIVAIFPMGKNRDGTWQGLNFTFYGLLVANAVVVATILFFTLMGSLGVPLTGSLAIVSTLFAVTLPMAKMLAGWIEKKGNTFTTGGASFTGMVIAPLAIFATSYAIGQPLGFTVDLIPALAALSISYLFGEGLGRLGCISFGCCYGRPLHESHPLLRKLFANRNFIFSGATKKIAYAAGWEGMAVVPIQAITAVFYLLAGLLSLYLFTRSFFLAAFLISQIAAQGWRYVSEFFRSDFRGGTKISAYQLMGIAAIIYSVIVAVFSPAFKPYQISILNGLLVLWGPASLIFLFILWFVIVLYMGKSRVTGSVLAFFVHREKI